MGRNLIWLSLCVVSFCLGFLVHRASQGIDRRKAVASVNGDLISKRELEEYLSKYRLQALEELLEFKVIQQYANRQKIAVSESEVKALGAVQGGSSEEERLENYLRERKLRGDLLMRKIILHRFTLDKKRELFAALSPELMRYTLTVLCLAKAQDEKALRVQLAEGADFLRTVAKFSREVPLLDSDFQVKEVTIGTLETMFGPHIALVVPGLQLGELSQGFASPYGRMVVRLEKKLDDYSSLEPHLNNLIVESQRAVLSYYLMTHARVETDFNPLPGQKWKPQGKAERLPKPAATPLTGPNQLPAPLTTGTPIPQGIQAPVSTGTLSPPTLPPLQTGAPPDLTGVPKPTVSGSPVDTLQRPR
ncbi:hypothetical protein IV102_19615 [bacterium]|nr:hypothetical protein [bacterium]